MNVYKLSFAIEMQIYTEINIRNANFDIEIFQNGCKKTLALGTSELQFGLFFPPVVTIFEQSNLNIWR